MQRITHILQWWWSCFTDKRWPKDEGLGRDESARQWTWYYHSVTPLRDISKLTSRKVKHDRSLPQETQRSKEILTQAVKFSKRQDKEVENPQKQELQPMCRNDKSIGTRYPEEKSKINKRRTANRCIRLILALITAKCIDQMKFNRRM